MGIVVEVEFPLWVAPFLSLVPEKVYRFLDIGCGDCTNTMFVEADSVAVRNDATLALMTTYQPSHLVLCNALDLALILAPKSFDLIVALDVIEHLKKDDGYKLVEVAESLSCGRIIFFTPLGYHMVHETGETYQCHLSGWYPDNFTSMGYSCWVFPNFHDNGVGAFYAVKDDGHELKQHIITEESRWKENFWVYP